MLRTNVLFIPFFLLALSLQAQDSSEKNFLIELNFGRGVTGLHHTPADLYETSGRNQEPEVQKSNFGNMFHASVARRFGKRNYVGVMLGYTDYRYQEEGVVSDGMGGSEDYKLYHRFRFLDIGVFYKLLLYEKGRSRFFVENELALQYDGELHEEFNMFRLRFKNNYLFEGANIRYRLGLKYAYLLTNWLQLQGSAYYMTSINDYNTEARFEPYNLGLSLGVGVRW